MAAAIKGPISVSSNDSYLADYDDYLLGEPTGYENYEEQFDPLRTDRKARRGRKPRHAPKRTYHQDIASVVESTSGLEGGFTPTYQPSRHEEGWLLTSLRDFYDQSYIVDVLAQVKGGKEASVYRCQAHPATGMNLLAAKVYRPRMLRNLRNDKLYRQGRAMLNADGRPIKKNDHRVMRAIGKKSAFGVQVQHTSWLMYEYTTLERLYADGAAVPRPVAGGENAILMEYIGDQHMPAPMLVDVALEPGEAHRLYQEVLRNIELLLRRELIHGDLSPYNILYWEGRITLIDFPQVIGVHSNKQAYTIFQRDVTRVCEYFARSGVDCQAEAIADDLWTRHVGALPVDIPEMPPDWLSNSVEDR